MNWNWLLPVMIFLILLVLAPGKKRLDWVLWKKRWGNAMFDNRHVRKLFWKWYAEPYMQMPEDELPALRARPWQEGDPAPHEHQGCIHTSGILECYSCFSDKGERMLIVPWRLRRQYINAPAYKGRVIFR